MVNALCYPFYRFCYYVAILKYTSSILLWYRETDKMSAMNNTTITLEDFFSECYLQYYDIIKRYITFRIDNSYEAEDLVQDAFVRLWEHRAFVNKETVRPLLFTIARNLVTDKVRRYYKKAELLSYIYKVQEASRNTTEETVCSNELQLLHGRAVNRLPGKRRQIYELNFRGMPSPVIADTLSLSVRTVEGQLLLARKSVRNVLKQQLAG